MKGGVLMTFEFKAAVSYNGQIVVPSDVAGQIPPGKELHVVLTFEATADNSSYRALGKKLHEASSYASVGAGAGAGAEETVYDSLA
jgi:hypothetical protein